LPSKLIVVIVLLAANIIVNLTTKSYLSSVLGALLIYFMVRGSHSARAIGIWGSVLGLGLLTFEVIRAANAIGFGNFTGLIWALVAIGVVSSVFTIWTLTRRDVIDWFDEKNGARVGRGDNEPPRYV